MTLYFSIVILLLYSCALRLVEGSRRLLFLSSGGEIFKLVSFLPTKIRLVRRMYRHSIGRVPDRSHSQGGFPMHYWPLLALLGLASLVSAQQKDASDQLPTLEHLSAGQVDPQVDPCTDFYQYTCNKFFTANPIPADQSGWGVAGPLLKWNEVVMRQALEAA